MWPHYLKKTRCFQCGNRVIHKHFLSRIIQCNNFYTQLHFRYKHIQVIVRQKPPSSVDIRLNLTKAECKKIICKFHPRWPSPFNEWVSFKSSEELLKVKRFDWDGCIRVMMWCWNVFLSFFYLLLPFYLAHTIWLWRYFDFLCPGPLDFVSVKVNQFLPHCFTFRYIWID